MIFKRIAVTILLVLLLSFGVPGAAFTAGSGDKAAQLRSSEIKAAALQQRMNRLAGSYQTAYEDYTHTRLDIRDTKAKIDRAQSKIRKRQKLLSDRADFMYRHGNITMVDVLLGANDFSELVVRYDILMRITNHDADLIAQINKSKRKLDKDKKFLSARLSRQANTVNELSDSRRELESVMAEQKREVAALSREIETARRQARLAQARSSFGQYGSGVATRVSNLIFKRGGYTFPVAGGHAYASTFGAPRRGHTHQGNDIFGAKGTPLVAVTSGSVRRRSGGIGGLAVWLNGRDGNCYYYAHLNGFAATGSVSAGTVIGYLGDTGNARGTSPHLHFEIHPGCGRAVDPYPILRSWE